MAAGRADGTDMNVPVPQLTVEAANASACLTIGTVNSVKPGQIPNSAAFINCALLLSSTVPYFELPMPISRVQLLMQFRMGSHALPVEQGRLAKPAVPRHLRRCTLCGTRALGDGRHFVFDCPHFAHIRRQFRSLYQDADGTMQCFVWHKDQKAVCHCLAAILNVADDSNKDASS